MPHHNAGLAPLGFLRLPAEEPRKALGLTLGAMAFVVALFGTLFLALGADEFLPFSTAVPLYLINHYTRQRDDAVRQVKRFANFSPIEPLVQLSRGGATETTLGVLQGRDSLELKLGVVYAVKNRAESIFTVENLREIQELERWITTRPQVSVCVLLE